MVRSGKELMARTPHTRSNRRNRRMVAVAAILVVLLAGVLGELSFGDDGAVASAQAGDVVSSDGGSMVALDAGNGDSTIVTEGSSVASGDAAAERPSATPIDSIRVPASPLPGSTGDAVAESPEMTSPSIPSEGSSAGPALEADPAMGDQDGSDGNAPRRHGVDDHAVEHSDRHAESEAIAHGRDEEAHQAHRSSH